MRTRRFSKLHSGFWIYNARIIAVNFGKSSPAFDMNDVRLASLDAINLVGLSADCGTVGVDTWIGSVDLR